MTEEFEYTGTPIRSLQTMLHIVAAANDAIETVTPDGIYGEETRRSVSSFQREHGIPVTGVADLITWEALVGAYDNAQLENGPAAPLQLTLQPGQIILPEEENLHMHTINGMLAALKAIYPSMPPHQPGGTHSAASVAAIRWLQTRAGLEPSGYIDRRTWKMLAALYRISAGDGVYPCGR